jgi:hypothetical protein
MAELIIAAPICLILDVLQEFVVWTDGRDSASFTIAINRNRETLAAAAGAEPILVRQCHGWQSIARHVGKYLVDRYGEA